MHRCVPHHVGRYFTVRHMVIIILYLAILFQLIIPVVKLAGCSNAGSIVLGTLVLSPIALAILVGLIEPWGALKNWVLAVLILLFFPALVLHHDCAALVTNLESGRRPTLWATLLVNSVVFINCLPLIAKMVPSLCPRCGQRTLVPLTQIFREDKRTANTCWCACCGAMHWKDREGNWRVEVRKNWLDQETDPSTTAKPGSQGAGLGVKGTNHRHEGSEGDSPFPTRRGKAAPEEARPTGR